MPYKKTTRKKMYTMQKRKKCHYFVPVLICVVLYNYIVLYYRIMPVHASSRPPSVHMSTRASFGAFTIICSVTWLQTPTNISHVFPLPIMRL